MNKYLFVTLLALFLIAFSNTPQPVFAKKPQPTPTPRPTSTPLPTPTPLPTATPTPIPTNADIVLTFSGPTQVSAGQSIQYTITATNIGPDIAHDVEFCSLLTPSQFALVGFDQGTWDHVILGGPSGRYTNCSVWGQEDVLGVGMSATMSYSIADAGNSFITNSVDVSSVDLDPDTTNNSATLTTTVTP